MYHFLGSVYFALPLIAFFALFVIMGTILEAKTGSHWLAAYYTYEHPAFSVLLSLFFINILLATLRRYPFQWKKWPFLLTHLGLLMVLSGTIIKNIYGVQGNMEIVEGSGSHTLIIPKTESLRVEKKGSVSWFDLKRKHSPFKELKIELIGWAPNSQTEMQSFLFANHGKILGLPSFPITKEPVAVMRARLLPEPYPPFHIYTTYPKQPKLPALIFQNDAIVTIDKKGRENKCSLENCRLIAYDEGYGGYTHEIPLSIQTEKELEEELMKLPYLPDPLKQFKEASEKVDQEWVPNFIEYALQWNESGNALFPNQPISNALESILSEIELTPQVVVASGWLVDLLKDNADLRDWPHPLPEENRWETLFDELLIAGKQLPEPPKSQMQTVFSAYLIGSGITKEMFQESETPIQLESPIFQKVVPETADQKWEDNRPMAKFRLTYLGKTEVITLPFDHSGKGLSWPVLDGTYLLRYQPKELQIPHHLRLRRARRINYDNSAQAKSYEADLWIDQEQKISLSMNNVHETTNGYRFYLSSLSSVPNRAARIGIVVNKDPARRYLTYPGAIFLTLGTLVLLSRMPRGGKN
ncbi:MAG: cytochrome c biogenesis protein ResB [Waddliaceae bacterium]